MATAPKSVQVTLDLKFLKIAGTWEPNDAERKAAWEMYVELVTRVGVVPLRDGLLRETLNSFYSLFSTTRSILKNYGPVIAEPKDGDGLNFGYLAVSMLNAELRPILSYWHPLLMDWEERAPATETSLAHERSWQRERDLRVAVEEVGAKLRQFVGILAQVCGVPNVVESQ